MGTYLPNTQQTWQKKGGGEKNKIAYLRMTHIPFKQNSDWGTERKYMEITIKAKWLVTWNKFLIKILTDPSFVSDIVLIVKEADLSEWTSQT